MRCCNGERTEKCDYRKLFHLYISSNHQMWVNYVMATANIEKLLKGRTTKEKVNIVTEIESCIDSFKEKLSELLMEYEDNEKEEQNTPKCFKTYTYSSCACANCKWRETCRKNTPDDE